MPILYLATSWFWYKTTCVSCKANRHMFGNWRRKVVSILGNEILIEWHYE